MFLGSEGGATNRYQFGEKIRVQVLAVDSSDNGVTGQTVTLSIRNDRDGTWWDGTNFVVSFGTFNMTQTDSTNMPGCYYYEFTPNITDISISFLADCAGASVVNEPWVGDVVVGSWVDNIDFAASSLSSASDMDRVLKRIGSSILDADFRKVLALQAEILRLQQKNMKQ